MTEKASYKTNNRENIIFSRNEKFPKKIKSYCGHLHDLG